MLILGRAVGESIVITVPPSAQEEVITVHLLEIKSKLVARIGVMAKRSIAVHRQEVQEEIEKQRKQG